ncbi:MAG: hypothetical protein KBT03_08065 [Bacteroidales bacterium]|nr:hypothetical protein [Candidatus Scybalousia scybalohippi]
MKFEKTISYHCSNCGASLDPRDGKCSFCNQTTEFRTYLYHNLNTFQKNIRVFVKAKDGTKVYLHEVSNIASYEEPQMIEVSTLYEPYPTYVRGMSSDSTMRMDMIFTRNAQEKIDFINNKGKLKLCFESDLMDKAFVIDCEKIITEMPQMEENSLMTMPLVVVPDDFKVLSNKDEIYVDDGTTCPNCAAKLRQRFGLCDYCGGWSEIKDYYS